jgi:hypothetical protein
MPYIKSYKCSSERIPYSEEKADCALLELTKELNATTICHLNGIVFTVFCMYFNRDLSTILDWTIGPSAVMNIETHQGLGGIQESRGPLCFSGLAWELIIGL